MYLQSNTRWTVTMWGLEQVGSCSRISPSAACAAEHKQVLGLNSSLVLPQVGKNGLPCPCFLAPVLHFLPLLPCLLIPGLTVQGKTSLDHSSSHLTTCLWGNKHVSKLHDWVVLWQAVMKTGLFLGGYRVWNLFCSVVKFSDRLLSEKDMSLVGGIAHVCPVSEEDRMAAAKADLERKTQSEHERITFIGKSDLKLR